MLNIDEKNILKDSTHNRSFTKKGEDAVRGELLPRESSPHNPARSYQASPKRDQRFLLIQYPARFKCY